MKRLEEIAEELGFIETAEIDVDKIKFVPEYRAYCEENVCGMYNKVPTCPPQCGSFKQMHDKVLKYKKAFVMKTVWKVEDFQDNQAFTEMKSQHNMITKELVDEAKGQGIEGLTVTVGPTKSSSCISAYCIDVGELAKSCEMECFCGDNRVAFFSMLLYNPN